MSGKSLKVFLIFAGIAILVFGVIYGGISFTKNLGKSQKTVSAENAMETLNNLYSEITVNKIPPRKDQVSLGSASVKPGFPPTHNEVGGVTPKHL